MTAARALVVLLVVAVLAGAGASQAQRAAPQQALTYQYVPFDQVDPQRVSDGEDIAGQDLLEGLVAPDAAGTGVVPATADSWKVSNGGTVYTFHIRQNARWSDGSHVTAQDFAWAYKRLLTPSTAALDRLNGSSSYQNDLGIENALNFQLGKNKDWSRVGVRALDASHLRIVLDVANASFLQEMASPSMVALPQKNIERFPYSWQTAKNWVGNGPFVMQSWTLSSQMVLVPNEQYWDRKHVYLDRVTIATTTATDDDVRARYTSSALDVAKIGNPDPFLRDATLAPAVVRLHDYSVKFLTLLQSRNPALRDLRVRQAIALGISRADVARASSALDPATSLVPRALPRFDQSVGFKENLAKARALLAEAGYPGGKGFPKLIVMTSYDDAFVRVVVRTLRRNLGIKAVQDVEDSAVESAKREEVQPANVVGFFSTGYTALLTWRNWVSDSYPPSQAELLSLSPDDYTHYQVLQAAGTQKALAKATAFLAARASPESKRFASAAARADSTANAARAIALYKQAAALRQGTYEFIPYAYSSLAYVVRPGIKGVHLWTGYFTISFKGVSIG